MQLPHAGFRLSLKYRIAVVILSLEVVVMVLALGTTLKKYTESNQEQWAVAERVQLNLLSDLSRIALLTAEYDELQPYIEQAVADPHTQHVLLVDRHDRVVVSSMVDDVGKSRPPLIDTDERFWRTQEIANASGRIGMLAINFSHSELLAANRSAMDLGITIAASGIIFISIVSVMIGHLLTRRLRVVTSTAQRFASGDLSAKANLSGNDEVAQLGQAFDTMAANIEKHIATLQATEGQLRQSRSDLERRVMERTAELAVARDQALEASRTKSAFLANMSHELRTPLNAIIGYSEMLAEDAVVGGYSAIAPDLKKIKIAGKHLLSLINEVLDLAKIEAGKVAISAVQFEVASLIEDAAASVRPLLNESNISLRVHCETGLGSMYSDEMKLRQALINLLSNACKFTEHGSIDVVAGRFQRAGAAWIKIAVIDTGIGIAAEQIEKLFADFYQVDRSTTRKYGGTGLGLAISRRFCQMMGGEIVVESRLHQGSTFTILLPVDFKAQDMVASAASA